MKKLKLIWDFRGPDAKGIAEHHEIHLREYGTNNKLDFSTGTEEKSTHYYTAWITVNETAMPQVRDALRPHRGEIA